MTITTSRDNRTDLCVTPADVEYAQAFNASLALLVSDDGTARLEITQADSGRALPIPTEVSDLLRQVLDAVSQGDTVTIHSLPRELTTTTAAKMLGISRPTLMKLIAEERIPAHKVGSHTRVLTTDVNLLREQQLEKQRRAFDKLLELDEELGIDF